MLDSNFIRKNAQKLLKEIDNDKFTWKGSLNGDNLVKFQGRKIKQLALVLLLVGEEMEHEEIFLDEEKRRDLFHDHIRGLSGEHINDSGTSRLNLNYVRNLWKTI